LPDGPPVRALQRFGVHISVPELNRRVREIHDAHDRNFGHPPSSGLVFDLIRAPQGTDYEQLLTLPRTMRAAEAQRIARAHGLAEGTRGLEPDEVSPVEGFLTGLGEAVREGTYAAYVAEHKDVFQQVLADRNLRARFTAELNRARAPEFANLEAERAGFGVEMDPLFKLAAKPLGFIAKAEQQVIEGVRGIPAGVALQAQAGYGDVRDLVREGDWTPERTARVAKEMARATWQDVRHPLDNPGYLFLDVLGLSAGAGGAVARMGTAAKLAKAGAGAGQVGKALVRRPEGGTFAIGKPGGEEQVLLSENQAVRLVQKQLLKRRQQRYELRQGDKGENLSAGALAELETERAVTFIARHFALENKIGREARARRQLEEIIRLTYVRELEAAAGWSQGHARIRARLPGKLRAGLSRGEQMAIFVSSIDDPTPLATLREFHERMVTLGVGDPKAHQRKLADLRLAEQILSDPARQRDRFKTALELTREAVAEMEHLKIENLGLSPITAEGRVAALGEVVRSGRLLEKAAEAERLDRERLAVLEKRMEGLIERVALSYTPDKGITAKRNARAGVRARKGLPPLPTQKQEARAYAERQIMEKARAEAAKGSPEAQRLLAEVEEAARLRTRLQDRAERQAFAEPEPPRQRVRADSFYLPTVTAARSRKLPRFRIAAKGRGQFGVSPVANLPELQHEFTGAVLRAGNYRIDATALAGEAYGRTVRVVSLKADYDRLLALSHARKQSEFDVPIRAKDAIPEKLRELLNRIEQGQFTAKDADLLGKDATKLILAELYPNELELSGIEGVRWIDSRQMIDTNRFPDVPGPGHKLAQAINEPFRDVTLYLRPAYALNLLSNAGMLLLQQGPFVAPVSFLKALAAPRLYGEKVTRTLDALGGESRSRSFVADVGTVLNKPGRSLAGFWHVIADQQFRRASMIYEFNRKGIRSRDDFERALFRPEGDDAKLVNEAKRRGNKALVEFDNLSHYEQHYLRHIIFVYPWMSRATVWSLRTLIEHPIKVDALVQLARVAEGEEDPVLKLAPEWFERGGYFPVGWTEDGKPKLISGNAINTFSTLGEMVDIAKGQAVGDRYAQLADLFGPAAEFLVHGTTGKDEFGNSYEGNPWIAALRDQVLGLPQARAAERARKTEEPLPAVDVTDRDSAVTREHAALGQDVLDPGLLGGWGMLASGSLTPREFNALAAQARYWRDQPLEKRHAHEMGLIRKVLGLQARLLRRPVPADVREAVELTGKRDLAYAQAAEQLGHEPTYKEKAGIDLDVLAAEGRLSPERAERLREQLAKLSDRGDIEDFKDRVLMEYGGKRELGDWDRDVRMVASFDRKTLGRKLAGLEAAGLIDSAAVPGEQQDLYEYGRKYLAYSREVRDRFRQANAVADPALRASAFAEFAAWEGQHDQPVVVNGRRYPSLVRLAWAHKTPEAQAEILAGKAAKFGWAALSSFDKELLGRKAAPNTAEAWAAYQAAIADYKVNQPAEERTLKRDQLLRLAKQIDTAYPGFLADWQFDQKPLYQRLRDLRVYRLSASKGDWQWLFAAADKLHQAVNAETVTATSAREQWADFIRQARPWLQEHSPRFALELALYEQAEPRFLFNLVGR
jgi:hypothetical protein